MAKIHFQFPINLCVATSHFFAEACKKGLESWRSQYLWNVLKEILSQPQNLLAQKKFLLPVEKAEIAPEILRNGFSVIPVQDEELRLMMEILNLPTPPGGRKSVLISHGKSDFPELLKCLKETGVIVNVIAIDEPMPAGFDSLVENWINISASPEELEKADDEATLPVELEENVEAVRTEKPEENQTDVSLNAPETEEVKDSEPEEEVVEAEEETVEEKLTTDEVLARLAWCQPAKTNVITKAQRKVPSRLVTEPRYDVRIYDKATRIVNKLNDAIEECALQKEHLANPESAETPVQLRMIAAQTKFSSLDLMSQIFSHLKIAYDWLGRVLSETPIAPNLATPIVSCGNCVLRLLGMYYRLLGNQGDEIYNSCFEFINSEVKTKRNQSRLDMNSRRKNPWPSSEIGRIGNELENLNRVYADRISESQVKKRLESNVQKMTRHPENYSEIFGLVMDDVHQLFTYFGCKPDDDFICNLFRPILNKFPEESEYNDDFYRIRSEIEYKSTANEMSKYTPSQLENKYHSDPNVQTVRKHFQDQTLVVIGGIPKPEQKKNFEDAFGCEVEWEETSHGDSLDRYQPYLRNPHVCAFMVLIQLSSHKHSQELGALASKGGKPFFRIHTTNPIAAAKEIVEQYIEG